MFCSCTVPQATCCLAINLCHNDTQRQKAIGSGILIDLVESLKIFLPTFEDDAETTQAHQYFGTGNSTNGTNSTNGGIGGTGVVFASPSHEVVCAWLLKFCACVSFEDTCAVDMIFLNICQYAIVGMKIACLNGNNDLFSVCANLISNLVITAHDEDLDMNRTNLKKQMVRHVWRDGVIECVIFVLHNAQGRWW